VREARNAQLEQATPFGPLIRTCQLPGVDGRPVDIDIQCPFGMLHVCAKTKYFGALLSSAAARSPPTFAKPWRIIIYSDEITPGNAMKPHNSRMLQAVYWSFVEFGAAALAHEDFWLTAVTLKSTEVLKIDGGMSAVTASILKHFFGDAGRNLQQCGITLYPPDTAPLRLHAYFCLMLADESALHQTWMHMGASGVKLCVQCMNIVPRDWAETCQLPADHFFRPYTDPRTFTEEGVILHTRASIRAVVAELAVAHAAGLSIHRGRWDEKCRGLGFKYSPHGLLADPDLRDIVDPVSQNCYDWAHTLLSGVFPTIVGLLVDALKDNICIAGCCGWCCSCCSCGYTLLLLMCLRLLILLLLVVVVVMLLSCYSVVGFGVVFVVFLWLLMIV
jgi:hypothetical protein